MQTKIIFKLFDTIWGKLAGLIILMWAIAHFFGDNWLLVLILPTVWVALHSTWTGRIVTGFASGFVRHAHEKALSEWNGNYYQWGNQQIRIIEKDDCVWVVGEDLLSAAGMKLDKNLRRKLEISYFGYRIIPGTKLRGFNEKAVLEFLNGKQDRNPEIIKLKLWFEREVFLPLKRKR